LQSDWRGLPIICRSCAQSRTPPMHSQVNFRCTRNHLRYTPNEVVLLSKPYLNCHSERSEESPHLFLPLLVFARHSGEARISVIAVVCSCRHPERSRSQPHRERLSRRTPAFVLVVACFGRCLFLLSS
jgi:hypothetical protein